jgi:hypothetical protein
MGSPRRAALASTRVFSALVSLAETSARRPPPRSRASHTSVTGRSLPQDARPEASTAFSIAGAVEADGELVAGGPPEARDIARRLRDQRRKIRHVRCIRPASHAHEDGAHGLAERGVVFARVRHGDGVEIAERLGTGEPGASDERQRSKPGLESSCRGAGQGVRSRYNSTLPAGRARRTRPDFLR